MLIPAEIRTLDEFIEHGPFVGYVYSYPHKTAYRPFDPPLPLEDIWRDENVDSLFLYVHIPFCEVRCGFCNLFTYSQPEGDLPSRYLQALERQMRTVRERLPRARFSRVAIGGGTPTFLNTDELRSLFDLLCNVFEIDGRRIPISIEASPATIDAEKLACLREFGVDRLSVGIQSFNNRDVAAMGRPQNQHSVAKSLDLLMANRPRVLNLDLIYGGDRQTQESWTDSLEAALRYAPEEIYLYPLYVRPLTGLSKSDRADQSHLVELYRIGRDELLSRGYEQYSLRMFRRTQVAETPAAAPIYRCQEDGMIGLGCGARSYTRTVHYADRFAVKQSAVLPIIHEYIRQTPEQFAVAQNGLTLNADERRRRYLVTSLLLVSGLDRQQYARCFRTDVVADFASEIEELVTRDFAVVTDDRVRLTPAGLEFADAIGPWLYSAEVRRRMEEFAWNTA